MPQTAPGRAAASQPGEPGGHRPAGAPRLVDSWHSAAPELTFLLRCLAVALDPARPAQKRCTDDRAADREKVVALAARHRVRPLLYRALGHEHGAAAPPDSLRADLRRCYLDNVARTLQLGATLDALIALLAARNVPALPFKGLATSVLAHGDESAREIGDIDLLVRPADYARARALLRSEGWKPTADWGWESSFLDPSHTAVVDLHRSVASPAFRLPLSFGALHARRTELRAGNRVVVGPGPEDTLILLCVQIVKDGLVARCTLGRVCDVAGLLHRHSDLDWVELLRRARRLGCRRVLATGLVLARQLLGAPLPAAVPPALLADADALRVSRHIAADLLRTGRDDDRLEEHEYLRAARERWRDRALPRASRWLRLALTPSDTDRNFVRLPASLGCLYYAVRPIRVLRDRGRRALGGTSVGPGP